MILILKIVVSLGLSYLIGSIPTAYIFGRVLKKIDIREYGSGNVGATNAFRVLGKGPGIIVLLLDILKGVVATAGVSTLLGTDNLWALVALSVMVVVGHNWTVFLNFKGGKGIATSLGVLIGLTLKLSAIRPVLFLALLSWIVVFLISGFVSLSSMAAATVLPFLMIYFNQPLEVVSLGIIICIFVILRHRPNIRRLLSGKESRVNFFSKKKSA